VCVRAQEMDGTFLLTWLLIWLHIESLDWYWDWLMYGTGIISIYCGNAEV
jgi:hypothetical protein